MSRLTGAEMGDMLSRFVNSSSTTEREELSRMINSDHRTLQEDTFMVMLNAIYGWAKAYEHGYYDERNKYTCRASAVMIKALKDEGLF